MAKSVSIKNFRGFSKADLHDCRRINLIVGDNGSGKTALLEGIFCAAGGSPELALRVKQWRGIEMIQAGGTRRQIAEALWGDLFHDMTPSGGSIEIRLAGSGSHNRSLRIDAEVETEVVVNLRCSPI